MAKQQATLRRAKGDLPKHDTPGPEVPSAPAHAPPAPPAPPAQDEPTLELDMPPAAVAAVQQYINNTVNLRLSQARTTEKDTVISGPDADADLTAGDLVGHDWHPPTGWQKILFDDGHCEAHPSPPSSHDPEARRKILDKVDEAYSSMLPTPQVPDRKKPQQLLVNMEWRKLFKEVQRWGDTCPITVVRDKTILPEDGPRFKFVTEAPY